MELSAEAVEILQDGRRQVMVGWCQGALQDQNGAVCAYGAIALSRSWGGATVEPASLREALFALEDEVGLAHAGETEVVAITRWNDAPERTHADVVALFDRVLTKAAARDLSVV